MESANDRHPTQYDVDMRLTSVDLASSLQTKVRIAPKSIKVIPSQTVEVPLESLREPSRKIIYEKVKIIVNSACLIFIQKPS